MRSYTAAHVLNPLAAPFMGLCQMKDAIKDLRKFQLDEFCPGHGILDSMAEEIPSYLPLIESTPDSFWTSVEGAKEYWEMLKEKRANDPEKWNEKTWKDDSIEKTGQMREWWREYIHKLTYFSLAACLVAPVQISNASVERVFSQVKFIVETIGLSVLEDTMEIRLMSRINEY